LGINEETRSLPAVLSY